MLILRQAPPQQCLINKIERYAMIDVTSLITALNLTAFAEVIESLLPIVGVAVLVGFLFYVIRWAIGLFRGI